MVIRLWLLVLVLSLVSWFWLKLTDKPKHFGWVLLFWIAAVFGTMALFYGISLWFVTEPFE